MPAKTPTSSSFLQVGYTVCMCVNACVVSVRVRVNERTCGCLCTCVKYVPHTYGRAHTHTPVFFFKGNASLFKHFASLFKRHTKASRVTLCRFVPLAGHPETRV
jgi:hypothetical protein